MLLWITGSGNGLLPDGTKPLPDSMLIDWQMDHQKSILCILNFNGFAIRHKYVFKNDVLNHIHASMGQIIKI